MLSGSRACFKPNKERSVEREAQAATLQRVGGLQEQGWSCRLYGSINSNTGCTLARWGSGAEPLLFTFTNKGRERARERERERARHSERERERKIETE